MEEEGWTGAAAGKAYYVTSLLVPTSGRSGPDRVAHAIFHSESRPVLKIG